MIIKIKNLKCETVIGVYELEKKAKQRLILNAEIDYNEGNSIKSDKIVDTLNYHEVIKQVKQFIEGNSYELLEKMVEEVGHLILSFDRVISARVEIDKPDAPIEGIESVSVSKTFKRGAGWFPMI